MLPPLGGIELAVLRAIAGSPHLEPVGIAETTNMNLHAVDGAIAHLEQRGLLQPSQYRLEGVRIQGPEVVVDERMRQLDQALSEVRSLVSTSFKEVAAVAAAVAGPAATHSATRTVSGADAITTEIVQITRTASENIDTMLASVPTEHMLTTAQVDEEASTNPAVVGRIIYPPAARTSIPVRDYLQEKRGHAVHARTSGEIPLQAFIADNETVVLPTNGPGNELSVLISTEPAVVTLAAAAFQTTWDRATPLGPTADPTHGLTELEQEILEMLSAGHKDAAIAHELGIAHRTVGRTLSALREKAGVTSRFALAIEATRHGWLK